MDEGSLRRGTGPARPVPATTENHRRIAFGLPVQPDFLARWSPALEIVPAVGLRHDAPSSTRAPMVPALPPQLLGNNAEQAMHTADANPDRYAERA